MPHDLSRRKPEPAIIIDSNQPATVNKQCFHTLQHCATAIVRGFLPPILLPLHAPAAAPAGWVRAGASGGPAGGLPPCPAAWRTGEKVAAACAGPPAAGPCEAAAHAGSCRDAAAKTASAAVAAGDRMGRGGHLEQHHSPPPTHSLPLAAASSCQRLCTHQCAAQQNKYARFLAIF